MITSLECPPEDGARRATNDDGELERHAGAACKAVVQWAPVEGISGWQANRRGLWVTLPWIMLSLVLALPTLVTDR